MFITFEGIDGSGKSTQLDLLNPIAEDRGWILTRNPGGTDFGQKLRMILLEDRSTNLDPVTELLLFYADRKQHLTDQIIPALMANKVIVCDRFQDSTLAYQGYGRGLDLNSIRELYRIACQDFKPDLTFLFDLDPVKALSRTYHHDKIEAEGLAFQGRVREGYLSLARQEPNRFRLIDTGTLSIQEAHRLIVGELEGRISG